MKYTILLRRSPHLLEVMDDDEAEFYTFNPDTEFEDLRTAVKIAKVEAARADSPDYTYILSERGVKIVGSVNIMTENYEVVMVIEGQHRPKFWYEPELRQFS